MGEIAAMTEDTKPLDEAILALGSEQYNALEAFVMLKRAEEFLATKRQELLEKANEVFVGLRNSQPESKRWTVLNGLALVTSYTPKSVWEYPSEIVHAALKLKDMQKQAQLNQTARKISPVMVDPAKNSYFAVTVVGGDV